MKRRAFLLAASLALAPAVVRVQDAHASVAALLSLDELVTGSTYVVVATAGERRSEWEDLPSGRRIVTYTKLSVDKAVVGKPSHDIWVRTLGGAVDNIGQSVSGEARIVAGSRAMLFLAKTGGALVVTAMAQGHYPVVDNKLVASPDAGLLVRRRSVQVSARERLVGSKLDDAVAAVLQVRKAHDAK